MTHNAAELYKDYWTGKDENRSRRQYYERLYDRVRRRLEVPAGARVLDVAGGNGNLMRYLGVNHADILDISESGLEAAAAGGYRAIAGDIEERFPFPDGSYDTLFLFEVLEHLHRPDRTLSEARRVLAPAGCAYIGQPNMRADGAHHVRRYYLRTLLSELRAAGLKPEWVDYVPAYSMRDSIVSDIRHNPSWARKIIQTVNLGLSLLPYAVRYRLAQWLPDRFALILIVKAVPAEAVR